MIPKLPNRHCAVVTFCCHGRTPIIRTFVLVVRLRYPSDIDAHVTRLIVPHGTVTRRATAHRNSGATFLSMPSGTQPVAGALSRAVAADLLAVMEHEKISILALSTRAGISRSYLRRRLLNESSLTLNDVESLCAALGIDVGPFLHDAATQR